MVKILNKNATVHGERSAAAAFDEHDLIDCKWIIVANICSDKNMTTKYDKDARYNAWGVTVGLRNCTRGKNH